MHCFEMSLLIATGFCPAALAAEDATWRPAGPREGTAGILDSPASGAVTGTRGGARLHCATQDLDGEVTKDGLWLRSTAKDGMGECFRLLGVRVKRQSGAPAVEVSLTGSVTVAGPVARFIRDGLTEEYSVSMDGVRQDFIVERRPEGRGELRVEVQLTGATAEALSHGVGLTLDGSGRKLVYNQLRVTDAGGEQLPARMEPMSPDRLAVLVNDAADTLYPVRIDPTFTDADWNAISGVDDWVNTMTADGAGNLYIGGAFTMVGNVAANRIAKWDGSTWSALGTGMDGDVWSLAVAGQNVYAGGYFTKAGGTTVHHIAKWNGTAWSALGSGVGGPPGSSNFVAGIAVLGTDVYAAGEFTTAGGVPAANIARWNGNAWSPLEGGLSGGQIDLTVSHVWTLAVMGSYLYAGGEFTVAGENPAAYIAKWDGIEWSPVGAGMDDYVYSLAVMGTNLFAGGEFHRAGGNPARYLAKWNGSTWSALPSELDGPVAALAVAGTDLYAGGWFTEAGPVSADHIARWDGSTWSALGSGVDGNVTALAVVGPNLYVAGDFEKAGQKESPHLARANICLNRAAPGSFSNLAWSPATGFSFTFLDGTPGQPYRIQASSSSLAGPWVNLRSFNYTGPVAITDPASPGASSKFYRAISP